MLLPICPRGEDNEFTLIIKIEIRQQEVWLIYFRF